MATNFYRSSHRIYFDGTTPTERFGWFISTSSDSESVDHFSSESKRSAFVALVQSRFPDITDAEECAAFLLFKQCGHGERFGDALDETDSDHDDWSEFLEDEALLIPFEVTADSPVRAAMIADDIATIRQALEATLAVIEDTYGHDDDGERDESGPPDCSAADIVERLCNIEMNVADALTAIETLESDNAKLAREVYETLYCEVESFEGGIGMQIAYLVGGILTDSGVQFFAPLEEGEQVFHDILKECFEPDHAVWKWVTVVSEDDQFDPEHESTTRTF